MFTNNITRQKSDRLSGLFGLIAYAYSHPHSAKWLPTLMILLAREGASHG
jgi:hypothetical protein